MCLSQTHFIDRVYVKKKKKKNTLEKYAAFTANQKVEVSKCDWAGVSQLATHFSHSRGFISSLTLWIMKKCKSMNTLGTLSCPVASGESHN